MDESSKRNSREATFRPINNSLNNLEQLNNMSKMFEIIETQDMISDFFKQKRNLNKKLKRITASRSNERNKGPIPFEAQHSSLMELTQ